MERIIGELEWDENDVFVDLGSGIGSIAMQVGLITYIYYILSLSHMYFILFHFHQSNFVKPKKILISFSKLFIIHLKANQTFFWLSKMDYLAF